ncbi:lecithin-cholesterol acyltransferase-like 1 [Nymphaea colorata]|nr:lecithin-cholesterol acyltransferase-like 1 [Nymphaea colorata]
MRRRRDLLLLVLLLMAVETMGMLIHNGMSSSAAAPGHLLHPIVVVPGSGGNQLEARLTDAYKPSSVFCRPCARTKDWFRLWFDASVLVAPLTKCFADRMTLHYDAETDTYRNAPGVETRVPHFGSTRALLNLDPNLGQITSYMAPLVHALEEIGYVDEQTLFGAPYDFRYGLGNNHSSSVGSRFLADLKGLVEKASSCNGGKKVILISHSLGGLWTLHLLNRNSLSWRRKYVQHFIALSPPWAGTVQELIVFASGYSLGVPLVNPLLVRAEQRSSESNLWLLPSPVVFGRKPVVITPNRTYSASDIPEFLADIGFPEGVNPYKLRILPLMSELVAPLVPVTCLIGTGVDTPETLFYGKDGFDRQPEVVYGDGDGTVNSASLLAAVSAWEGVREQSLKVRRFPHVSHTSILKDEASVSAVIREVSSINSLATRLVQ